MVIAISEGNEKMQLKFPMNDSQLHHFETGRSGQSVLLWTRCSNIDLMLVENK